MVYTSTILRGTLHTKSRVIQGKSSTIGAINKAGLYGLKTKYLAVNTSALQGRYYDVIQIESY